MKSLIILIIAAIALPRSVNANWFNKKEVTFQEIEAKCKSVDSKYFKYNQIGMTQFAKNYLKICMETKVNKVLKEKYEKCLERNNKAYCNDKIRKWLNK